MPGRERVGAGLVFQVHELTAVLTAGANSEGDHAMIIRVEDRPDTCVRHRAPIDLSP